MPERDYPALYAALSPVADYVVVNVSSPNTPGLRQLQELDSLRPLLRAVRAEADRDTSRRVPLLVKIAPDLTREEVEGMAGVFLAQEIDGVIATNTTLAREAVAGLPHAAETGGLSGRPVREGATRVLRELHQALDGRLPLIGVGGIDDADSAGEKIAAGASLVQIYTGFIYQGPSVIARANAGIAEARRALQVAS